MKKVIFSAMSDEIDYQVVMIVISASGLSNCLYLIIHLLANVSFHEKEDEK